MYFTSGLIDFLNLKNLVIYSKKLVKIGKF